MELKLAARLRHTKTLPCLASLQIHPRRTRMRTSSWRVSVPSSLCPPPLAPTAPRWLQNTPGIALLSRRCFSLSDCNNGIFSDWKTWLFQTEFSQELQTAGSTEKQPVAPQHQQRRPFTPRSAQPAIHTCRPRTRNLASCVFLQSERLQDTNGVVLKNETHLMEHKTHPEFHLIRPY